MQLKGKVLRRASLIDKIIETVLPRLIKKILKLSLNLVYLDLIDQFCAIKKI
jgi:hypothetical protein